MGLFSSNKTNDVREAERHLRKTEKSIRRSAEDRSDSWFKAKDRVRDAKERRDA